MTEQMMVEAVRAVGGPASQLSAEEAQSVSVVADPSAVSRFQAAMDVDPVPFASEVSAVWRTAQVNNQGLLHRIRALTDLRNTHSPSMPNMIELQYEVMNLTFQQEVVTKVADKASNAVQTLIKNQ